MEPTEENIRAYEAAHRARADPVELPPIVQRTLGDLKQKRVLNLHCGTGEATAALAALRPGRERARAGRAANRGARGVSGRHRTTPPRPPDSRDLPPLRPPHVLLGRVRCLTPRQGQFERVRDSDSASSSGSTGWSVHG